MDMTIILALIATGATVIAAVYAFLRNFKIDLNGHISRLERDINNLANKVDAETKAQIARTDQLAIRTDQLAARSDQFAARSDQLAAQFAARSDQLAARSDQLYQIIIDLLKDRKKTDP
jgi:methyl-accepting chemotaxis protein